MQLIKFSLILLLFTSRYGMGQDKVEWSANYNLKKEDFKGVPPRTETSQTIHFQLLIEYTFVKFPVQFTSFNSSVKCNFIPSSSWIAEGENTAVLLRYAQINWDLRELAARKLRKLFYENKAKLTVKATDSFYEQVIRESSEIEAEYDKDTDFGRKDDEQKLWELKAKQLLDEYAVYCQTCKSPKRKKS